MFKINIITQLLIFFVMAISVNFLSLTVLVSLFLFVLVLLAFTKNNRFLRSLLRFKWFFVVMLFIFSFNTPGEYVQAWPFAFGPTYEGIVAGVTQTLRIMLMLAGLSLILACNTRQNLISGFYFIFSPLKFFGLQIERFAARLWLTLHYVELQSETKHKQDFMRQLKNMAALTPDQANEEISVTLTVPKFNVVDFAVLAMLLLGALIYVVKVIA
jgi:energy-coupling factor transporter transmembrane protein EcfT